MRNFTIKKGQRNKLLLQVCFFLLAGLVPSVVHPQNYRNIDAYLEDFRKNEMFIKKSLIDYTITIVESQMDSRSRVTAARIIEKIENINTILKNTDRGYKGNTELRDSFIKMNEKTLESLKNGSLILNDYDYQSSLTLSEIKENLTEKEKLFLSYYEELKNYEQSKKYFGKSHRVVFKKKQRKNILEYNARQNLLFYKINVIDEKLTKVITAVDKKGFTDCMTMIGVMHQDIMVRTAEYKNYFADNSLNEANIGYANFINSQNVQLQILFNDYATAYEELRLLKNSTAPETTEIVAAYNQTVRDYNAKKNLFYALFNQLQATKQTMYDKWFVINASFLKKNGEFDNIHERYAFVD